MNNYERYIISAASIAVAVYLRSPIVALIPLLMCAVKATETVFTKASTDAELVAHTVRFAEMEKRIKALETDLVNVTERAQTILGGQF